MKWILLIVFQYSTYAVVVESRDDCLSLGNLNMMHWLETGQQARAYCTRTTEI